MGRSRPPRVLNQVYIKPLTAALKTSLAKWAPVNERNCCVVTNLLARTNSPNGGQNTQAAWISQNPPF